MTHGLRKGRSSARCISKKARLQWSNSLAAMHVHLVAKTLSASQKPFGMFGATPLRSERNRYRCL